MEIIRVENLEKTFPIGFLKKKKVLQGVSFSVQKGSAVGFIGANGSGKTTTIKCILNFIFPDQGQIHYFGQKDFQSDLRKKIGFVPERPYLPDYLTVEEFLKFHWKLSGENLDHFPVQCQKILDLVQLQNAKDRPLRAFSKGMQQRAALAQALLLSPELIILDEPMSGLDPDGRLIVKDIIRKERQRGTTVFFSSHLLSDMDELCSHIIMMDSGRVVFSGTIDDFSKGISQGYLIVYKNKSGEVLQLQIQQADLSIRLQSILQEQCEILSVQNVVHNVESAYAQYQRGKSR